MLMTNVEENPVMVFMDPLENHRMMMPASCWGSKANRWRSIVQKHTRLSSDGKSIVLSVNFSSCQWITFFQRLAMAIITLGVSLGAFYPLRSLVAGMR